MLYKGIIFRFLLILVQGITFAILPLIARKIGASDFSLYSISYGLVQLIVPCIILQLDSAFVRFMAGETDSRKFLSRFMSLLLFVFITGTIFFILVLILPDEFSRLFYGDSKYQSLVYIVAIWSITRALVLFCRNYYRTLGMYEIDFIIATFQQLAICLGVYLSSYHFRELHYVFVTAIICDIVLIVISFTKLAYKKSYNIIKPFVPIEYWKYSVPLVIVSLLAWVVDYSDQVIIVHMLGHDENSRYAMYYMYARLPHWIIISPINYAFFPFVSKLDYSYDSSTVHRYIKLMLNISLYLIANFIVLLLMFGTEIIEKFANQPVGVDGIMILLIVGLGVFGSATYQLVYQILSLKKATNKVAMLFAFGALANITANLILIPFLGTIGAALATCISYSLIAFLCIYYSQAKLSDLLDLKKHIFVFLLIFATVFIKISYGFHNYVLSIVTTIIISLLLLAINSRDIIMIFKDLRKV